ncbi:MAG: hypothetical protein AAGA65_09375 [Actinomycetota bacterium]
MLRTTYNPRTDWLFYLVVASYAYLIISMTYGLWFGDGVNVFASYHDDPTLVEANEVYWSKTTFLFLTLLLAGIGFDYRFAVGFGATFWAASLTLMFGATPTLVFVLLLGTGLLVQQAARRQIFIAKDSTQRGEVEDLAAT